MEERYIPKYLNAQPQVLWWDFDEFLVLMVFVGLGVILNHQLIGAFMGYISMKAYSKFSKTQHPGYFKHLAYSMGLWGLSEKVPEYWVKELVR